MHMLQKYNTLNNILDKYISVLQQHGFPILNAPTSRRVYILTIFINFISFWTGTIQETQTGTKGEGRSKSQT